jgi:hypothetical protein
MTQQIVYPEPTAAYLPALEHAIIATVAYADVFNYPLRITELQRYLIGTSASVTQIRTLFEHSALLASTLSYTDGLITLAGREQTVTTRLRRAAIAEQLWPKGISYGHQIARLPFVRMVALTGSLAVDNTEADADLDYLVVTEPGRLWICRMLTIALVRLAKVRGDVICPNYFLAETALALDTRDLYTAHELTQMMPISGMATYQRMRRANEWIMAFLPNAADAPPRNVGSEHIPGRVRTVTEQALRLRFGNRLETWEMQRKILKFAHQGGNIETAFSPEWCKGHFDGHGQRVMAAYRERLAALTPNLKERFV